MMCPHSKTADGFEMQLGVNHLGESCCSTFINLLKYLHSQSDLQISYLPQP